MRWSITIGSVGGTAVKIHITFILFLVWIAFSGWTRGGAAAALDSTVFIVLLFACVVLHEFGHITAARRYGIKTPEVTLLPIGGVASLQRLPSDPRQELVVALAGPAVNLVIGLALILALGSAHFGDLEQIDDPKLSLLGRLAVANIFLVVFNLIPAFPMDGGRVLHALLAMRVGGPRATEIAARIGQALAFGLGFLGLFGNPLLLFIAIFVYIAAGAESQMSAANEALKGVSVGDAMETRFTPISIDANLTQAVDALLATAQHEFPVVDAFGKPVGLLTRDDILSAVREHGGDEPAAKFMRSGVPSVRAAEPVQGLFERLQDPGAAALYVTDAAGKIIGLLTRHALGEVMMIRAARPDWRFDRKA
ncbi:MAG: site-2 protease family protein [Hyphomicrobiales bacterium]|nr:site-2 protease family protein [Hyphomicrobiales bacterium]